MNIDDLMKRKLELNKRNEVLDVPAYAEEWNQLAAEFEACGMEYSAESCRMRWMFYRDLAPGAYIRRIETFVEILPTHEPRRIVVWSE